MVSEKVTPELASCYDEIDQIYDYIRGLVPLPPQLRKIKSIDFEQLEQDKKLFMEQLQRKPQQAARTMSSRPVKPRQRQADDGASEQLKGPQESPLSRPGAPLKLTLSSGLHRPAVKRVESLNLSRAQPRPAYLITPNQNQQFRLPRAHSTSTLVKPGEPEQTPPLGPNARTLPGNSRIRNVMGVSGSLARLRDKTEPASSKLDSVESYIDERSDASSSSSASSSSDSTSARAPPERSLGAATLSEDSSTSAESETETETDTKSRSTSTASSASRALSPAAGSTPTTRGSNDSELIRGKRSSLKDTEQQPHKGRTRRRQQVNRLQCNKSPVGSPSDYENEGSASSSLSDLLACSISNKTADGNRLEPGSQSAAKEGEQSNREHIYEQIPAQLARTQLSGHRRSPRSTSQPGASLGSAQFSARKEHARQNMPFNYPMAFAPNVAPNIGLKSAYTRPRAYLATTVPARAPSMHNLSMSAAPVYLPASVGGIMPTSMRAHLAHQRPLSALKPLRPLSEHRHRLSMGNLHHLMTAHPLLGNHLAVPQRVENPSLTRSCQSNKKSPQGSTRAPRFSPAQLIAQIQVPRAVSKRQVQPASSGTPASMLVWRHPVANGAVKGISPQRSNGRRLTAIGIEHSLAGADVACEGVGSYERRSGESSSADAFIHRNRCQNSISDLHSASQSGSSADLIDYNSPGVSKGGTSSPDSASLSDEPRAVAQASDEGNFVSSRSFIKCYYGREKAKAEVVKLAKRFSVPQDSSRRSSPPPPPTPPAPSIQAKSKRRASKLLNLIGLNRLADSDKRSSQAKPEPRRKSIELATTNGQAQTKLVGEFLNEDGPILVRDRRILPLRPELVCHFEHPTVQVSKLPGGLAVSKHRLAQPGSSATLASTDTSNSTSSYEAAIKHGGERAAQLLAKPVQESTRDRNRRQPSSGSSLIRVPKLSRQSHLLNRPLPKLPVSQHRRASQPGSSGAMAPIQSHRRAQEVVGRDSARSDSLDTRKGPANGGDQSGERDKSGAGTRLSPLAVSIGGHQPSPTVTTCTSSGISSRMTQLAASGASNASSLASHKASRARVKSLSELHKQTKRLDQPEAADAQQNREELALMDAGDSPEPRESSNGGGRAGLAGQVERMEPVVELRLFDERFSSDRCFADQQLASSSDSLLESINFSGTLRH